MFFVPTTVAFKFLDFNWDDSLQCSPVNPLFDPQPGAPANVEPFYAGRSVLFALDADTVADVCKELKISLTVMKKMPEEIKPDILVGYTEVDMSTEFAALRKEIIDGERYPGADLQNPSKTYEGEVPLSFGDKISGSICVMIRVSGLGQTIVTELQTPKPCASVRSFIVKANDQNQCTTPLNYKCRKLDHTSCDLDVLEESGTAAKAKADCLVCKAPKLPCSPCRIDEGARISSNPPKVVKQCGQCGQGEHEKRQQECHNPLQPSPGPKEPCGKGVVLKISGLTDGQYDDEEGRKACVRMGPESEAATAKELQDPDHDVFILRIGKKGIVGANEKSDIQLEMKTPKGPERRPPVRLETREIQTEEKEEPPAKKKNGSSKGKKKK